MMTTKDILAWVLRAQKYHEENWDYTRAGDPFAYRQECFNATAPQQFHPVEKELVMVLFRDFWNDCQDWAAALES
jgi:hypothetical protein